MQTTPNPFPIPMFRVDTQANLKDKKLGDDDRKYIEFLRLCCVLMYKGHQCEIVR